MMQEADRQRLQNYRETGNGVFHDQVAAGLFRIGAIALTEFDAYNRSRAMAVVGSLQVDLSLMDKLDALTV